MRRLSPQPERTRRRSATNRAGLAPLELTLSLPILLFVMGLMIIAGTTAAWKARTDATSRQAAWRALLPRTGADDPNPRGWPEQQGQMRLEGNGDPFVEFDPYQVHQVVRGQPLSAPTGESVTVLEDALDVQNDILVGLSEIQRGYPVMANMRPEGINPVREHPILNGDWRFPTIRNKDGRGIGGNVVRRVRHMYPSDFEAQLTNEINEYQDQAIGLISDPDGSTIDLLDRDEELASPTPGGLMYEPPYGIGRSPNYFMPENRFTRNILTQPHQLCSYNLDSVRRIGGRDVSLRSLGQDLESEIRRVPQRITRDHLRMHRSHLAHIERLLDLLEDSENLDPEVLTYLQSREPAMRANQTQLEEYIEQLEDFEQSL
ncbi:MAG: hypothetical protein H8E37_10730 [Planctomycetes bacterium]|nr:hypothetical protein [Planctomycetota bacterium]